ncbi:hypothetical protein Zmor_017369 [Zophobas morio]|uniref:Uncharacterized protein n=1 Tax=Zophobas morio TaxID=2755281 RepID=A0AA38I9L0_9CUCU|nr:hypothetical protein Zmor_017369 [Zophobas morio]
MGITSSTIKIVNDTSTDIVTTSVSGLDSFDFVKRNHPSNKLNGLSINAKRSVECIVDLYSPASHCPVTVTLTFKDKSEDTFRIDLKYAVGCCARFNHSQRSHKMAYRLDNKKIIVTIENTAEQNKNEEAEELLRKAREAMRQRLYDRSLDHLNRAKNLATRADIFRNIRSEESKVCSSYGDSIFAAGLTMERAENLQAAEGKFSKAMSFFQRSLKLVYSGETQQKIHLSELKISGNRSVSEAMKLKDEAFEMVDNEEYGTALNKYEVALHKYKEARRTYVEGSRLREEYFSDSVKRVEQQIEEIDGATTNTKERKRNQEATELIILAKTATNEHRYYHSLEYLNRAKILTNQSDAIKTIKNEECQVYCLLGETLFQEGMRLENDGSSKRAQRKFDEAKSCFQQAVNLDIFGQETESLFHRTMSWVQGKVGLFQNKPQQNLHISELKISGNNSFFQAAKLKNQAVDMIRTRNYQMALNKYAAALGKYQEAKKKFAEGAKYRKEYFSNSLTVIDAQIVQITDAMESTYERKRSEEFEQLMGDAREAKEQRKYDFAFKCLERARILANQANTVEINNEESQVCNLYGEALFKEGVSLEEEGHFEKAHTKFVEAKSMFQRAGEEFQRQLYLIETMIDRNRSLTQASKLKDEALQLIKKEEYFLALNKFDDALNKHEEAREVENTGLCQHFSTKAINKQIEQITLAIENTKSKALIQKAKEAAKQHFFEFALENLDRAKAFANQSEAIECIKSEERHVLNLCGNTMLEEGLLWEKEGHLERAQDKFEKAKSSFQKVMALDENERALFTKVKSWFAQNIGLSNEIQQKLRLCELKISANGIFAEAIELKKSAVEMVKSEQYQMVVDKYNAALTRFEEAKTQYVDCEHYKKEYFADSVAIVNEQIQETTHAIENTVKTIQNEEAKKLVKQAKKQSSYQLALECLNRAKTLANQTDTIDSITNEESRVYSLYGDTLFAEGVNLEKIMQSKEAQSKFDKAMTVFALVQGKEGQDKLNLVKLKINGNKNFNEGVEFENEAAILEKGRRKTALNEALGKYREAREDFVEGVGQREEYFCESVQVVDERIEEVAVAVNDLNCVQKLQDKVSGLTINNQTQEVVQFTGDQAVVIQRCI